MKTIKFTKAEVFSWEDTQDEFIQEAMGIPSDIAMIVGDTIFALDLKTKQEHYAGDVHGAQGPVGLYIYTMEDDDWIYVAHYINEVEHQCFLYRHRKKI